MSNIIIARPILSDAATITCATATAAGPAANLQRDQPTDILESLTLTPVIVIDLGAVSAFNLIALLFTNAQQTDTWRIRTADTEANLTAAPTYDSGTGVDLSPWDTAADRRHCFAWRAAGWSNRWVRLDIDSTGNPDGTFDAGRLVIANAYQSSRNVAYGIAYGFIDASQIDTTQAGNSVANRQGIIPTLSFSIKLDNKAEFYQNTFRIQQERGCSRPVLVIVDPDDAVYAHDQLYYGLLNKLEPTTNETYNIYSQKYDIKGMI